MGGRWHDQEKTQENCTAPCAPGDVGGASHPGINLRAIQDREHIPTSDPFRALRGLPSESVSSLSQARKTDNFPSKMR